MVGDNLPERNPERRQRLLSVEVKDRTPYAPDRHGGGRVELPSTTADATPEFVTEALPRAM